MKNPLFLEIACVYTYFSKITMGVESSKDFCHTQFYLKLNFCAGIFVYFKRKTYTLRKITFAYEFQ